MGFIAPILRAWDGGMTVVDHHPKKPTPRKPAISLALISKIERSRACKIATSCRVIPKVLKNKGLRINKAKKLFIIPGLFMTVKVHKY